MALSRGSSVALVALITASLCLYIFFLTHPLAGGGLQKLSVWTENKAVSSGANRAKGKTPAKKYIPVDPKSDTVILTNPRLSDQKLLEFIRSCRPEHPSIIYYNRVPKCASESMLHYIAKNVVASRKKGKPFVQKHYTPKSTAMHPVKNPYQVYIEPLEVAVRVKDMVDTRPAIFDSHTAYVSYMPHNAHTSDKGIGDISYMNVIREPFSRLLSLKNYMCTLHGMYCNESNIDFFHHNKDQQLLFLCGHQEECFKSDDDSLYIAKVRLAYTYSLVGITEKLDNTTQILRKIFPDYFLVPYNGIQENVYHSSSESLHVTPRDVEVFQELNKNDIEFYQFALQAFEKKMKLCLGNSGYGAKEH